MGFITFIGLILPTAKPHRVLSKTFKFIWVHSIMMKNNVCKQRVYATVKKKIKTFIC